MAAVVAALHAARITQGEEVARFEQAVADYVGAAHAVACNSATSGLWLAYRALGLVAGSWLWTSPNTFVATAAMALQCGARVRFIDTDPASGNLSLEALQAALEQAERDGTLPRIVVPVHFAGRPCDMAAIGRLAERYGFDVVEDAAHALGARAAGEPVGSCRYSAVTVFSFHPVKAITTGEGGMALTQRADLAERMVRLRSHGVVRQPAQQQALGGWHYTVEEAGFNFRLTDFQAALGRAQLARLDGFIERRRVLAERYRKRLADLPLQLPHREDDASCAWHLYVVQFADSAIRRQVYERLIEAGIGAQLHYVPLYRQPLFIGAGQPEDFPGCEQYYNRALTLPLHPQLSEQEQDRVVTLLAAQVKSICDATSQGGSMPEQGVV